MESRSESKQKLDKVMSNPAKIIFYNDRSKQANSQFVNLFRLHKDMMRRSFLQFLESFELYRLALTCKEVRTLIDPEECGDQFKQSNHLKLIAMIQWLKSDERKMEEADQVFGVDV